MKGKKATKVAKARAKAARQEARILRCGGCGGWLWPGRACTTCTMLRGRR